MTLLSTDLKFYKGMEVSDASTNGGHRSDNVINSGSPENVFRNTLSTERLAGSTKYRFIYICNHNTSLDIAANPNIWLDKETPAGDYIYFIPAVQGMTQADIIGTEDKYTVLELTTNIAIGGSTFVGNVADSSIADSIETGSVIRISNKATPDSVTGTEEFVTVTGTPSVSGAEVSFTFTPVTENAYTVAEGTKGSKVYQPDDIVASIGTITKSSSAGTIDEVNFPVVAVNNGTIEEVFTFTFSSATQFTVAGARIGAITAGVTTSEYSPNNSRCSLPYFTLPSGFFTGTWANGDTLTVPTHDSSAPVCEVRVTPAGISSYSSNGTTLAVSVESS